MMLMRKPAMMSQQVTLFLVSSISLLFFVPVTSLPNFCNTQKSVSFSRRLTTTVQVGGSKQRAQYSFLLFLTSTHFSHLPFHCVLFQAVFIGAIRDCHFKAGTCESESRRAASVVTPHHSSLFSSFSFLPPPRLISSRRSDASRR